MSGRTRLEEAVDRVIALAAVEQWFSKEIENNPDATNALRAANLVRRAMANIRLSRLRLNLYGCTVGAK